MQDIDYDIQIVDRPELVQAYIFENNKVANRARILAGYCWEWDKSGRGDTDAYDIEIGGFKMSWNLDNSKPFAIDETSVHEVGCIHTSQGLEFDYVGVIIGEDLIYRNCKIVTDFNKRDEGMLCILYR